jgi:hypothetical protein
VSTLQVTPDLRFACVGQGVRRASHRPTNREAQNEGCKLTKRTDAGRSINQLLLGGAPQRFDPGPPPDDELENAARDEILKAGGSLSHHHGVGRLRSEFLPRTMSEAALRWRAGARAALDPRGTIGGQTSAS